MVKWVKALAIKPNNQFDTQAPLEERENWLPPAIWVQGQHKLHETLSPIKQNKTKKKTPHENSRTKKHSN